MTGIHDHDLAIKIMKMRTKTHARTATNANASVDHLINQVFLPWKIPIAHIVKNLFLRKIEPPLKKSGAAVPIPQAQGSMPLHPQRRSDEIYCFLK